jgi:hypothetical protein
MSGIKWTCFVIIIICRSSSFCSTLKLSNLVGSQELPPQKREAIMQMLMQERENKQFLPDDSLAELVIYLCLSPTSQGKPGLHLATRDLI